VSRFYWMYSLMLIAAATLASLAGLPSLFSLPPTQAHLIGALVGALGFTAFGVLGSKGLVQFRWYRDMASLLKRLLTHDDLLGRDLDTARAFPIAAYSSLGEEAFFRGLVQPWLILRISEQLGSEPGAIAPIVLGVVVASVLFGAMHFPVLKELRPWTLFAIVAGLGFGFLAAFSGSLLPAVLAHFLINWLNLRWLAKSQLEPADLEELFGGASGP
jgi:membrane protease YdiL (CAAX protease family)